MRRRRKAGNASGTKKGKTKKEKGAVDIGEEVVTVSDKEAEMSLTAMDVVDSTNHHYFGHGHHHFHNTTSRQTPELEVVPPVQNHKAVGARKRKPTQISKVRFKSFNYSLFKRTQRLSLCNSLSIIFMVERV